MQERLQKLIARAGLASRRTAEQLIRAGAVRVNGQVVRELGTRADPERDQIEVEGRRLRFSATAAYLLLNKPRGYVSTASDPEGRPTIYRLLRQVRQRVFSVGRLPWEVEGLLILTSDGRFADLVLRGGLPQTYWVKVKGRLSESEREKLAQLSGGMTRRGRPPRPVGLREVKTGANPWYEVLVVEPRRDRLRAALFRLGHPVEKVRRVAIGPVRDPHLLPGVYRELTEEEVGRLKAAVAGAHGGGLETASLPRPRSLSQASRGERKKRRDPFSRHARKERVVA